MPAQEDYFALFGLPQRYEVDRQALDAAYEKLSLEHHPDFFSTAPEAERQEAERVSARLNEGYRTLQDPLARAAYLLGLLAGDREFDKNSLTPEFLTKMFELQEEAEELIASADTAKLGALRRVVEGELEAVRVHLFTAFEAMGDNPPVKGLESVQLDLNTARYLQRLLERLDGRRDDD